MVKRLKIPIISALCVLSLAVMCVSLYISADKNAKFTPPEFDLGAIRGVPDEDVSGWCDATLEGMFSAENLWAPTLLFYYCSLLELCFRDVCSQAFPLHKYSDDTRKERNVGNIRYFSSNLAVLLS